MSYQALARKWRPQTFRDIIGQETVVRTLQNAIEQNRIHHAYLFSGVRGVGKTTAARIFAKAINCVNGPTAEPCNECTICREITEGIDLDVREIDAATYTGVDNVRELRDVTQFQPARDRRRIFIIDEVHMLSTPAWNALLKIIEEPPPHMLFLMATTEMQKVPATILSRVQRFVLNKISTATLVTRLTEIAEAERIDFDPAALEVIARRGEGSVRDALSILDQIIAFSGKRVGLDEVTTVLGLSDLYFFARLADMIRDGDSAAILEALEEAGESGRDFKVLYRDFLGYLRSVLLISSGADERILNLPPEEIDVIRKTASSFDYSEVLRVLNILVRDDEVVSAAEQQRLAVEIALLKTATLPRLRAVEEALGSSPAPQKGTPPGGTAGEVEQAASRVRPSRSPAPAASKPPRSSVDDGGEPASSPADLVDRVRQERKVTASYLEQARQTRLEGDTIVFEFDASQKFLAEYLSEGDHRLIVEKIASEIHGRPMSVRAVSSEPASADPGKSRSALQDDPILQAFARHLGGEVISRKS